MLLMEAPNLSPFHGIKHPFISTPLPYLQALYKTTTASTIEGRAIESIISIAFVKRLELPAIVNRIEKLLAKILMTGSEKRPTIPLAISDGKTRKHSWKIDTNNSSPSSASALIFLRI